MSCLLKIWEFLSLLLWWDVSRFWACQIFGQRCFLLNNTWWWMLLEARFFPQWGFPRVYLVSHFVGMLSILLHIYFRSMMGYVKMVIFFFIKFPYKWYQSYGCVVVTLDWIHGNAWEDKRKGKIYVFFIVDMRVLGFILWWDIHRFWACKIVGQKGFFRCYI